MKIKTISRSEEEYTRDCKTDLPQLHRNLDPKLHPFEKAREYTRALNATKLDKVFAKPFVGALDGHRDGVNCLSTSPTALSVVVSGSCDGEIRVWDISHRRTVWAVYGHVGHVRGVTVSPDGTGFLTCGDDAVVRRWQLGVTADGDSDAPEAANEWGGPGSAAGAFQAIDYHWRDNDSFVTAGDKLLVWNAHRAEPVRSFAWGADTLTAARFNPAEQSLVLSCGSDRGVCLFDTRQDKPLHKVVLSMRSNAAAWNPQEPMNFTVANEDFNLYSFDMRRFAEPTMVHKDHVGAVMDVHYSPTGREFVSGSYDRTVRIFEVRSGAHSREIYHTKRMQRVFGVRFTRNARFVLSASDDAIVRIWKAQASRSLAQRAPREQRKMNYLHKLKQRYKHVPQLRRIAKHRQLPRGIYKKREEAKVIKESQERKHANRARHAKPGAVTKKAERAKAIVKELD